MVSKAKKNALVRSSAILKSFLNWRFTILTCLKTDYRNFKAVIFFSRTHKYRFQLMDIFFRLSQPLFRIFFLIKPTKVASLLQISFTLSRITNKWLGEEETIGCCSFYVIFENMLFFIRCTEQNAKEIIWLRRCYLFIKTRTSILKWYGSKIFLRKLKVK